MSHSASGANSHNRSASGIGWGSIGQLFARFLSKKLVYPGLPWVVIIITLIITGLHYTFLSFYRPFGLGQTQKSQFFVILLISGTTGLAVAGTIGLAPRVLPSLFSVEKFNNTGFLILSLIGLIASTSLNLLLNNSIQLVREAGIHPYQMAILFLDIVIAPGFLLINVVDWRAKKLIIINLSPYQSASIPKARLTAQDVLQIRNSEGIVFLEVPADRFICAYSNQNYADIYQVNSEGKVIRTMVRISFTRLYEDLKIHTNLIRCHRTRIINLFYATELITYDRRTLIRMKYLEEAIPVSRNYPIRNHFPDR